MDYALLKTLHIISATIIFGTGLGTAFSLWSANCTHNTQVIASVTKQVVLADWLFTTPTVIFQPLSGAWLAHVAGYPLNGWVGLSVVLYGIAGACWLPVVWLQLRMRDMAQASVMTCQALPQRYWRYARIWFWLGVPAFSAIVAVFFLMVFKHV